MHKHTVEINVELQFFNLLGDSQESLQPFQGAYTTFS